jgi:septation ring formation regulator EzrA
LEIENLLIRYALFRQDLDHSQVDDYINATTEGVRRHETDALGSRRIVIDRLRADIRSETDNPAHELLSALDLNRAGSTLSSLRDDIESIADIVNTEATSTFAAKLMLWRLGRALAR